MTIDLLGAWFAFLDRLGYRPVTREFTPTRLPTVKLAVAALRSGRIEALASTLDKIGVDAYRSTIDGVLDALDEDEPVEHWLAHLERWHAAAGDFHSMMALACGLVRRAWAIRGGKAAGEVDRGAWIPFRESLQQADHWLERAQELRPNHPDPLCVRLITARGLQLDREEEARRFDALLAVDCLNYRGHLSMLENVKAKWGGSHGEMFKFARERAAVAPEGNALHALVVHAHFEMRNLQYWQDDPAADHYFRKPAVAAEILDAWLKSAGSARYVADANSRELFNLFAATLYLCGHQQAARHALRKMGGECIDSPWCAMVQNTREGYDLGWVVDRVARDLGAAA